MGLQRKHSNLTITWLMKRSLLQPITCKIYFTQHHCCGTLLVRCSTLLILIPILTIEFMNRTQVHCSFCYQWIFGTFSNFLLYEYQEHFRLRIQCAGREHACRIGPGVLGLAMHKLGAVVYICNPNTPGVSRRSKPSSATK